MNNKRIDNIWFFIAVAFVTIVAFTLMGWMNWADDKPQVNQTSPVNIESAVQSGGLVID
jgi:hypothetical protein